MKAYVVTADYVDASVLVFAEKTSQAKALAIGTDWLCDCKFTDLTCYRKPDADAYYEDGLLVVDGSTLNHQKIMRAIGWFELDGSQEECDECGLFEWENLPESHIRKTRFGKKLCRECLNKIIIDLIPRGITNNPFTKLMINTNTFAKTPGKRSTKP